MSSVEGPTKYRWPRVDPYALSDYAAERGLTAQQLHLFTTVVMRATWRDHEWIGSCADLSAHTRLSPKTVIKDMKVLIEEGLVEVVHPFRQGTEGRVRIVDLQRFAKVNPIANVWAVAPVASSAENLQVADDLSFGGADHDEIVPTSGSDPDQIVEIDLNEQGKGEILEAKGHGGSGVMTEVQMCRCGLPVAGHPFSDHDPTPAGDMTESTAEWKYSFDPEEKPF